MQHSIFNASRLRPLAAAIALLTSLSIHAQTAPVSVDLPAESLDKALNQLARQAGVQIIFASGIASDKSAPALKGNFTVGEALNRLLSASGLSAQVQDGKTFTVVPQPRDDSGTLLKPVQVKADNL
ncbi:MAG: Ferrichrome-iron receptor [Verrucomicrobiaceae bacterium]|nr:Ferrichrome-iron receptor [Verrucomicrobiaceae bacterium]